MKQKKKLPTGSAAPYKKNKCTMNLSFLDTVEYQRITITNMDITDTDISNASTIDDIRPEDVEENLQDNEEEEQTENTMSDLPSTSYAGKRIRSKVDKISVILAKRSKDTKDTILSIQEQNKLLATSMKTLCEEDDVDMFFKSIAMTVKKMSPQAIKEAKLRTLTLISEIDDKYSTPRTAQTLPYQVPSNYNNNMYQCQLSSPANSYSTSTSSQGFLPFNYDDTSNL
ncbi:BESS domain-containing protein [Aphis craccivora]|uniref:BESS domain-containing protein n=1 Tax=Aphis craccivora TaxID=307492 RepID=A0A6G0Y8K1_APHCR|nr:BESS domain-containing protein [Aphis craccivora]